MQKLVLLIACLLFLHSKELFKSAICMLCYNCFTAILKIMHTLVSLYAYPVFGAELTSGAFIIIVIYCLLFHNVQFVAITPC